MTEQEAKDCAMQLYEAVKENDRGMVWAYLRATLCIEGCPRLGAVVHRVRAIDGRGFEVVAKFPDGSFGACWCNKNRYGGWKFSQCDDPEWRI